MKRLRGNRLIMFLSDTVRFMVLVFFLIGSVNTVWAEDTALQQNGFSLSVKEASTLIGEALVKAGAGEAVKVTLSGTGTRDDDIVASAKAPIITTVDDLSFDKQHNRWEATLLLKENDRNLAPVRLSGHFDAMTQLPALKRPMQQGEVISENDIEWTEQPLTLLHKNNVTDIKDLLGKSPRHVISQDRPIRRDEIANPALIKKGERITLLFKSRNLVIKTLGEAMDNGAKGDVIRVKNIESKSIIEGTIEAGNMVRVTSPDTTTAAEGM